MASGIIGVIEQPDPADTMMVCGYWANLPMFKVESVYRRNSRNYVDVSRDGQTVTYRFAVVEQNHRGEDVEVLSFTEIEWADGSQQYERGEEP